MISDYLASAGVILFITAILILTSLNRSPGAGVIVAILTIAGITWMRGEGLSSLGFVQPESWVMTVLWSLILGILLALLSTMLVEPVADRLTGGVHDHSMFDGLRGNLNAFLKLLAAVWVLVAFLEEVIFRGFLMTQLAGLLGTGIIGTSVSLLYSSALFGVAHWYQGKSGALSTGIIGILLGVIYIAGGYNIWLPILTHGFIDTIGLGLVYTNGDRYLKQLVGAKTKTS
jgi:uncharacterized protein